MLESSQQALAPHDQEGEAQYSAHDCFGFQSTHMARSAALLADAEQATPETIKSLSARLETAKANAVARAEEKAAWLRRAQIAEARVRSLQASLRVAEEKVAAQSHEHEASSERALAELAARLQEKDAVIAKHEREVD